MTARDAEARRVTFLEAISQALRDEMRADPTVFLIGEDIGTYGGAFRVTAGFLDEFGPERVIDTPISESGFIGRGDRRRDDGPASRSSSSSSSTSSPTPST